MSLPLVAARLLRRRELLLVLVRASFFKTLHLNHCEAVVAVVVRQLISHCGGHPAHVMPALGAERLLPTTPAIATFTVFAAFTFLLTSSLLQFISLLSSLPTFRLAQCARESPAPASTTAADAMGPA